MSVATLTFYSEDDPLGSAIGTLTDVNLEILEVREALWEMPAAHFVLPRNHSAVTSGLIADNNYVTVTYPFISANPVFGFWLKDVEAAILSAQEQGGEYVQFGGPGVLGVLEHMRLWHSSAVDDQPTRGSADVPGKWWWTDEPYGAILTRVIEEGQETDYGAPLADVTIDFDRVNDSASAAWPNIDAEFEVEIGTDGLSVMEQLREAGDLYVIGHPDLLIQAFNSYGTDRTGAFGSGNVRFEKGVNILTELRREGHMRGQGTHLLLRDKDGNYSTEVSPSYSSGRAHHLYFEADQTNDDNLLNKIGQEVLGASRTEPEKVELEYTVGNDEANGRYLPWLHFNVGDQVTVHTGTGILDYNEQTFTIVAFRVELDEAADDTDTTTQYRSIRCVVELNHRTRSDARTKPSLPSTLVPVPPVPTTPGTPGTPATTLYRWGFNGSLLTDASTFPMTKPAFSYWENGGLRLKNLATGGIPLAAPFPPVTGGDELVFSVTAGNHGSGQVRMLVSFYDDEDGETVLSQHNVGAIEGSTPQTATATLTVPGTGTQYVRWQIIKYTGSFNQLAGYEVVISSNDATPATPGTGGLNEDLAGTPGCYAPCDHSHHVERAEPPSASDDENEGYPVGTFWRDSATGNIYINVSNSSGEAEWVRIVTTTDPQEVAAEEVSYDNSTSGLTATDVQSAIDELDDTLDGLTASGDFVLAAHGGQETISEVADLGATYDHDLADGNWLVGTLTEDCTLSVSGWVNGTGSSALLVIQQDGTGGHGLTLSGITWPGGEAPEMPQGANEALLVSLVSHDGGTTIYGAYPGSGGTTEGTGSLPLTAVVNGEPVLLWDENNSLIAS
jgi:hypothetical protein